MKKYFAIAMIAMAAMLTGCSKRAVDEVAVVGPSETAFLVALDGDTKANQNKLKSVEFLEANKISAKRILIPHKIIDTCPTCWNYDHQIDVPSAQLFKINRAPVTREWTSASKTGTTHTNQAFSVESVESIDFSIGATITAHIDEKDAAKFLYFYAGVPLDVVIDSNVRGFISTVLSREFGQRTYDKARTEKNVIFSQAQKEATEAFAQRGITIDTFGFTDGMTPNDPKIQQAINQKFQADMAVGIAEQQMQAAKKIAEASEAVKIKQDLDIRVKQADMAMVMANKWDGHGIMPQFVISNDGRVNVTLPVEVGPVKK